MNIQKRLITVILIGLVSILFLTASAFSDVSDASVLFLEIVNAPGAVAMGNCVVNNIDAQSALYNPGAMGLFYLKKNFSFSSPNNTMWLKVFIKILKPA